MSSMNKVNKRLEKRARLAAEDAARDDVYLYLIRGDRDSILSLVEPPGELADMVVDTYRAAVRRLVNARAAREGGKTPLAIYDSKDQLLLCWTGGHTVRIYSRAVLGRETAVASVGDFSKESLSPSEAHDEMVWLIESGAARELVEGELSAR